MGNSNNHAASNKSLFALSLGTVGTVYGDIGTSPLYAFRESIRAASGGGEVTPDMVIGVSSLIIWALFAIVTLKYIFMLMRADNNGQGGILSLMALIHSVSKRDGSRLSSFALIMGIAGASLFYGDSVITPAISVLSAVEGLKLITHTFDDVIIPICLVIMVGLFALQSRGTAKIAKLFAPIMVAWFTALAIGGLSHISDNLMILQAFNPMHAILFVMDNGKAGFIAVGAVVLAVTGAEALYADLGHFGRAPIRFAWMAFVMPALVLNYLGQGAMVLSQPFTADNSFFLLYPDWATIPMVALATMATIIASQAVITGAFSLTHQAVQLSLLPRLQVEYTSRDQIGQIYMPQVNWLLFTVVIAIIMLFQSSSALASAYGIAVTGTMIISTTLMYIVMRRVWKINSYLALAILLPIFLVDAVFLSANFLKFFDGGYVPVFLSLVLILMMNVWVSGSRLLFRESKKLNCVIELKRLLKEIKPKRVAGYAVFFSSSASNAPAALLHNLKHNKVLHEHNFLLTIRYDNKPFVSDDSKVRVKEVGKDFSRVTVTFGYMEQTNIPKAMNLLKKKGYNCEIENTSFFISRRHLVASASVGAPIWQDKIFIAMASNASDASEYFKLPKSRVVELGSQINI